VIIGESDDFRPIAALGRPDREAPVLARREGGVDESLLQLELASVL
jgi:hypothetical protein